MNNLTAQQRVDLMKDIGEEILTEPELLALFQSHPNPRCYDGFEPSGRVHIAQGLMKTISVNKMLEANCEVIFWVADIFAMLNGKMGGDLKKIQTVGGYMIEVWKACGMNIDKVKFLKASEEIYRTKGTAVRYWSMVNHLATKFPISRMKRCTQILGRKQGDLNPLSYLLYAAMQCVDVFFLNADICQLGMDQKKVNVPAREYADILRNTKTPFGFSHLKPIIISHHMLSGLKQTSDPQPVDKDNEIHALLMELQSELTKHGVNTEAVRKVIADEKRRLLPDKRVPELSKMSKSDPDSAVYMEDSEADVNRKIKRAFCRPGIVQPNPILEYIRYIILPMEGEITFKKPEKWGGEIFRYTDPDALEKDFENNVIHPDDIKKPVAKAINRLLQPVRDHFENDQKAKKLLAQVKRWQNKK
jgi:tyrosyl-tRNA synthetase